MAGPTRHNPDLDAAFGEPTPPPVAPAASGAGADIAAAVRAVAAFGRELLATAPGFTGLKTAIADTGGPLRELTADLGKLTANADLLGRVSGRVTPQFLQLAAAAGDLGRAVASLPAGLSALAKFLAGLGGFTGPSGQAAAFGRPQPVVVLGPVPLAVRTVAAGPNPNPNPTGVTAFDRPQLVQIGGPNPLRVFVTNPPPVRTAAARPPAPPKAPAPAAAPEEGAGGVLGSLQALTASVANFGSALAAVVPLSGSVPAAITNALALVREGVGAFLGRLKGAVADTVAAMPPQVAAVGRAVGAVGGVLAASVGVWRSVAGAYAEFTARTAAAARSLAESGASMLRQPLQVLDSGISAVNISVARFVQLSNPAAATRFKLAVDDLYAAIGRALLPALESFTSIVRSVGSAIYGTTAQGQQLIAAVAAGTAGLVTFGVAMAAVEALATGGIGPLIGGLVGAIGGLATVSGALNPLFQALSGTLSGLMDSLGGALGQFAGIVQAVLPAVQGQVQFFAGMLAYIGEGIGRLAPAFGAVVEVLAELDRALNPVKEMVVAALVDTAVMAANTFRAVAPVMLMVAQAVTSMVQTVTHWIRELLAVIGLEMGTFKTPEGATKDTTGMSARPAQTTDIESVIRQARQNAFSIGSGADRPEVATAKNTGTLASEVQAMQKKLGDLMKDVGTAKDKLVDIYNLASGFLKNPGESIGSAANSISNAGVQTPAGKVTVGDALPIISPAAMAVEAFRRLNSMLD